VKKQDPDGKRAPARRTKPASGAAQAKATLDKARAKQKQDLVKAAGKGKVDQAKASRPRAKTPPPEPARPWKRRRRKAALVLVGALAVTAVVPPLRSAAAMGASRVILLAASPLAPYVPPLTDLPGTSRILAADGSLLAEVGGSEARLPVPLSALPDHVRYATLAAEDTRFYEHSGVDPEGVFRALLSTVRGRLQGGSTITQQVAKINYTDGERTVARKLKEVLYAARLEEDHTKDQLLERYLNQVYFGDGAYGIEAAAQSFFGIGATDLSPAQAALLTGKLRAPEIYDPRERPDRVRARRDQVLHTMADEGWLTGHALEAALTEPVVLAPRRPPAVLRAPHFVEYVKREAATLADLGPTPEVRSARVFAAGMTVKTTLDPVLYDATAAAVAAQLGEAGDPNAAAASVVPGDGAIRSLFGGLDFLATQYDPASRGARQPGSAFKPFVYLAALRAGIDPRSVVDSTSGRTVSCYGDKPVQNYGARPDDPPGPPLLVDVDAAMVRSLNVAFAEIGCQVGVDAVLEAARDAGIPRSATKAHPAVFLGGLDRGVNPLTMAAAYATFAAGGVYAEPYAITEIRNAAGDVVYQRHPETERAFREAEVGVLNATLSRVVTEGTGRAAAIGRPLAGKTGTTQGNGDAWFAGYVPQLSTAVWVGHEPRRPMPELRGSAVTGGTYPARVFAALMRRSLRDTPSAPLPVASLDEIEVERIDTTTTSMPETTSTLDTATTTTTAP
jgi:penicillin-binding protein 1A